MNKKIRKIMSLAEVCERTGLDGSVITTFIERRWVCPLSDELDEEDLARIHLIDELRTLFGANDEAIPVILHLIDQLYFLRHQMR